MSDVGLNLIRLLVMRNIQFRLLTEALDVTDINFPNAGLSCV